MKKIPLWKVKRELLRFGRQVRSWPALAYEYIALTRGYDTMAPSQRKVHIGERPLWSEVAIYLIFPSKGLLPSHLDMLAELNAHEISPVLVSNLPLSEEDLALLKPLTARIIERPNIGYDFGGYRDGIVSLTDSLGALERLYILNDSVWMVESSKSWFTAVRDADVDFCGATSNFGIKRYDADNFRDITWTYTPDHPNFHYASYALGFGSRILRDPAFLEFWHKFRLSNSKKRTVRRGEIALTQWVLRKRYNHTATCPVTDLDQEIAALNDNTLDEVTRNLVIPERPRLKAKRDEVIKGDVSIPAGRIDRICVILTSVSREAIGYSMPFYTLRYRGFQFVKKSPIWLSQSGSDTMIALLDSLPGPMGRHAASEARKLRPATWPSVTSDRENSAHIVTGNGGAKSDNKASGSNCG